MEVANFLTRSFYFAMATKLAKNRLISYLFYSVVLLSFLILISFPILEAGFFGDDIVNSLLLGSAQLFHLSFLQVVLDGLQNGLTVGRFYPLSVFSSVTMHYLFPHANVYQIIRLIFIWLSVFSFVWLVKILTKNNYASLLLLLLFPMCWSIRSVPDPMVSYAIFIPLLTLFIGFTAVFFLKYKETKQSHWLAFSLFMYASALSTYEIGMTALFLLFILNRYETSLSRSHVSLLLYIQLTIIFMVVNSIVRIMKTGSYEGIELGNLSQFFMAFASQLISTLPLSYLFFANESGFALSNVFSAFIVNQPYCLLAVVYLFVSSFLLSYIAIKRLSFEKNTSYFLLLIGIFLMIIPAAIIALSKKYQAIITMGKGYLPVYLQYIGLGFLLIGFLNLFKIKMVNHHSKIIFSLFIASILSALLLSGWVSNVYTIDKLNDVHTTDRKLLDSAFHRQLIATIPQEALILQRLYLWNNAEFYQLHAKKKFTAIVDTNAQLSYEQNKYPKYYIDFYHLPNKNSGYVIAGKLMAQQKNSTTFITDRVTLNKIQVYISYQSYSDFYEVMAQLKNRLSLTEAEIQLLLRRAEQDDVPNDWIVSI